MATHPKRELGLSSMKPTSKGVSSEQQSSYFAEYRQGRIPGSPGLDDLRANANLGNAPSTVEVGSTRRVLFTSDASRSRDPRSSDAPQAEKGWTGAGNPIGPAVLAHADRQIGAAELQAGVQTAAVLGHADFPLVKGPTGPKFLPNSACTDTQVAELWAKI